MKIVIKDDCIDFNYDATFILTKNNAAIEIQTETEQHTHHTGNFKYAQVLSVEEKIRATKEALKFIWR